MELHFGKNLRHHLVARGIKFSHIANELGVHRQQVYAWTKKRDIKLIYAMQILAAIPMTMDEFFEVDYE